VVSLPHVFRLKFNILPPLHAACLANLIFLDLITLIIFQVEIFWVVTPCSVVTSETSDSYHKTTRR